MINNGKYTFKYIHFEMALNLMESGSDANNFDFKTRKTQL